MWKLINSYSLRWNPINNNGGIWLKYDDGEMQFIPMISAIELSALGDILRYEKPVWYHTGLNDFSTGWEPTGEEEN